MDSETYQRKHTDIHALFLEQHQSAVSQDFLHH